MATPNSHRLENFVKEAYGIELSGVFWAPSGSALV